LQIFAAVMVVDCGVDDGGEEVLMVVWRRLWWFWNCNDEDWVVFGG